jgi:Ca-activated chloride channel family protein
MQQIRTLLTGLLLLGMVSLAQAAGTLTPKGATFQPIQIRDHHVKVVMNNGFAMTEVTQTFFNPNDRDLEAVYAFPLPQQASLSEVTIYAGEKEIHGEVLARQQARQIYQEERDKGNDTGLAEKQGYQTFDFTVSPVRAKDETRIRFVYYQPLVIDTGIGRYLYPLQDGGTDDAGLSFWHTNTKVEQTFSVDVELKSAYPVTDVRVPGFEAAATITKVDTGHYTLTMQLQDARLERDFVVYYRLQDHLPGRIDLVPYRADASKPGTFMMVVTPGVDLQPLNRGADYVFVLDVSGSMQSKIATLARGIVKALGDMRPEDRLRLITFNSTAQELTRGWVAATPENVQHIIQTVEALRANGSTNLYAGLDLALSQLDDDRASSIVLVTDGVTNTGVIDPRDFYQLMQQYDVRVFGFLMGNNANWPLMRTITESSGGFFASVSNADDIIGQIMLAKSKITFEALHDVSVKISGVEVSDITDEFFGKVYRGQQLVLFGRYTQGGEARVTLKARLTGEDKTYTTRFTFPNVDTGNPEIERLWALARIEQTEALQQIGAVAASEAEASIRDVGLAYQLVTDHTSMVVLADEAFAERGIERRNQERVAREHQAQAQRAQQPARSTRVDQPSPAFNGSAPSVGGGAIDPLTAGIALCLAGCSLAAWRRQRGL